MRMHRLTVLALAAISTPSYAQQVSGEATAIDGDTLVIGDRKVRLVGIDAPELDQSCLLDGQAWSCGEEAKTQLAELVKGQVVYCHGQGVDHTGRVLATCSAGGLELGRTMVEYGWATAYRTYSDAYVPQEHAARARKAGIWRSEFALPEYHRRAENEPAPAPVRQIAPSPSRAPSSHGCAIKGNRSKRGEWIYHVPGMRYYDQTRPEEIFCSEAEARAAGYRRSKV